MQKPPASEMLTNHILFTQEKAEHKREKVGGGMPDICPPTPPHII